MTQTNLHILRRTDNYLRYTSSIWSKIVWDLALFNVGPLFLFEHTIIWLLFLQWHKRKIFFYHHSSHHAQVKGYIPTINSYIYMWWLMRRVFMLHHFNWNKLLHILWIGWVLIITKRQAVLFVMCHAVEWYLLCVMMVRIAFVATEVKCNFFSLWIFFKFKETYV